MCNLTRITKRKTATIYKAVEKYDGTYYSYFVGFPIKLGIVDGSTIDTDLIPRRFGFIPVGNNPLAINRTMGYVKLKDAIADTVNCNHFLKMKIGGSIVEGKFNNKSILAGSEILSFKEVKFKRK